MTSLNTGLRWNNYWILNIKIILSAVQALVSGRFLLGHILATNTERGGVAKSRLDSTVNIFSAKRLEAYFSNLCTYTFISEA
jgi:hypothetical protein